MGHRHRRGLRNTEASHVEEHAKLQTFKCWHRLTIMDTITCWEVIVCRVQWSTSMTIIQARGSHGTKCMNLSFDRVQALLGSRIAARAPSQRGYTLPGRISSSPGPCWDGSLRRLHDAMYSEAGVSLEGKVLGLTPRICVQFRFSFNATVACGFR